MLKWRLLALLLCTTGVGLHAAESSVALHDIDKRVLTLTAELRCLVCQNQTIAESNAELAVLLKTQVREKLEQGQSDQEITRFMVERYGEFVLYRPPVKPQTWLLWFGPFALLLIALAWLLLKLRHRSSAPPVLTEAEQKQAAHLLASSPQS